MTRIPKYWTKAKKIDQINKYFPDFPDKFLPDRTYFWNIINTQDPNCVKKLIIKERI